jgi:hypothetical protein
MYETQPEIQRDGKVCFVLAYSTELPNAFLSMALVI